MGRGSARLRHASAGWRAVDGSRDRRLVQRPARPLQGAEARDLRRAAEDQHRQDPEIRTATAASRGVACPTARGGRMSATRRALLAAPVMLAATEVQAQSDRPIRILVPYTPGAVNDILARLVAERRGGRLGQ